MKRLGVLLVLVLGLVLMGCKTITTDPGRPQASFASITSVPLKDFTSLGMVFTENTLEGSHGNVFTYNELLKLAHELGADAIINVTIDLRQEGSRFTGITKRIWYGSALAIKYSTGTLNPENVLLSGEDEGGILGMIGGSSSGSGGSGRKWYNPFTWFRRG